MGINLFGVKRQKKVSSEALCSSLWHAEVSSSLSLCSLPESSEMGSTDYRLDSLEEPVDVAKYLFTRLHQVGIRSVHGLPGDYNLASLDYVSECGLRWVGNVNELNAGECRPPGCMCGDCN